MSTFLLFDRHFGNRGVTLDNFDDNNLIVVRQAYLGTLLKCAVFPDLLLGLCPCRFFCWLPLAAELSIAVISLKNHNSSQEWARDLLFF